MPYPEFFVAPMREELTSLGVEELRTPGDVDSAVQSSTGTLMIEAILGHEYPER